MKLILYTSKESKEITVSTESFTEILDLVGDAVELKEITHVDAQLSLVYDTIAKIETLKLTISTLTKISSVVMELGDIKKYTFNLKIDGKLGDVLSTIKLLDVYNTFSPVDDYIKTDVTIIKYLLTPHRGNNPHPDINHSLVLRYLSEEHGKLNYSNIYEMLRHDFKLPDLQELLPEIFTRVYHTNYVDIKYKSSDDKLDICNIDDDVLHNIEEVTLRRLGALGEI